jgi:hypothetical protein
LDTNLDTVYMLWTPKTQDLDTKKPEAVLLAIGLKSLVLLGKLVGTAGFEPATTTPPVLYTVE